MSRLHINFAALSFIIIFSFVFLFLYLNQKVNIYIGAYQLNSSYNNYEELSAQRDHLMYSYNKNVSLPRVNEWANQNNFSFTSQGKMLALDLKPRIAPAKESGFTAIFNKIVSIPAGISTALARNAD